MSTVKNGLGVVAGDRLVKVDEAARLLGVCRSQVYVQMDRGELPFVKLPGAGEKPKSRRIPLSAVHAFIDRNTVRLNAS
jgi:excisionase family DNA binding protein